MTLPELLDIAKLASLGSYSKKNDESVVIKLLNHAMVQTYSRVPALREQHHIHLTPGRYRYEYMQEAYNILEARTSCGTPLSVNDSNSVGIFDIGNHVIEVPETVHKLTDMIVLTLAIKPPKVTCENIDKLDFMPDDALAPAILSYMAYMAGKGLSENGGQIHLQEFELHIRNAKSEKQYNRQSISKPEYTGVDNGWV